MRKGEKHRGNHLRMFWEQGVLEIFKKVKLASLGKKSRQFPRKIYLNEFFSCHVTG